MTGTGEQLTTLEARETEFIHWIPNRTDGNHTRAAEIPGIDRVSLRRKLKNIEARDLTVRLPRTGERYQWDLLTG